MWILKQERCCSKDSNANVWTLTYPLELHLLLFWRLIFEIGVFFIVGRFPLPAVNGRRFLVTLGFLIAQALIVLIELVFVPFLVVDISVGLPQDTLADPAAFYEGSFVGISIGPGIYP